MLEVIGHALYNQVQNPVFGRQHLGITPGGPQDNFAYQCGNILLDNENGAPALEIIQASKIIFHEALYFVLTGAARNASLNETKIEHGLVTKANKNDVLTFTKTNYGFRTYLCYTNKSDTYLERRLRGSFNAIARWQSPSKKIRVVEGPEYKYLRNPKNFFDYTWRTTNKISSMGMHLERPEVELELTNQVEMISEAVADGTVQLTPQGPLVLLRHRQTIGGYPRIFNVISADVDMLAQYGPQSLIQFQKVTMTKANNALRQQQKDLKDLKARF